MPISYALLIECIESATDREIQDIMDAVGTRFRQLHPDWEILYLACPKNDQLLRQQTLDAISAYLRKQK